MGKREKMLVTSIFSFSQNVFKSSLYQATTTFKEPERKALLKKIVGKGESTNNTMYTFFPFPVVFSTIS